MVSLHDLLYGKHKQQVEPPKPFYNYNNKYMFRNESFWFYIYVILFVFFIMFILKHSFKRIFAKDSTFQKQLFKKQRTRKQETAKVKGESKGETAARIALVKIFEKPFDKIRPDFLRNKITDKNLELDLFNEELMLAIEVQGRQHYEYVPFFHNNNYAVFRNQQYRDEIKRMICEKEGIKLIEIPYTVQPEDVEHFIRVKAVELGYEV